MDNLIDKVDTDSTIEEKAGFSTFSTLLLLIVTILVGSLIGNLFVLGISQAWGVDLQVLLTETNEDSPLHIRNFLRIVNLVSHVMTFSIPSIVLIYFLYKRKALQFFKLHKKPYVRNIGYAFLLILVSFPLAQFTFWLNQQLPLPQWALELENSAEGMLKSVLNMQSPVELIFNLLVVAIIPSIGEELLFRGIIQQKLEKSFGNAIAAIWITAIIFSAFHMQFQGFIPRMILGAILGYLLVWTRNLWIPIIGHFIFNGSQILAQYFYSEEIDTDALNFEQVPWLSGLISGVILLGIGYSMYNYNRSLASKKTQAENDSLIP